MVKNVLGTALQTCCTNPLTGFYRDGKCNTGPDDVGMHTICVRLTDAFLQHQASIGNDLITARPQYNFPGLKAGDHWCVCIELWKASYDAGVVGPCRLEATHERALDTVSMEMLLQGAALDKSRAN